MYRLFGKRAAIQTDLVLSLPFFMLLLFMLPQESALVDSFGVFVLIPAIVFVGISVEPRWTRPCATLGILSYAVYVVHNPLIHLVDWICEVTHPGKYIATFIAIMFSISMLAIAAILQPLDKLIRRSLIKAFDKVLSMARPLPNAHQKQVEQLMLDAAHRTVSAEPKKV